MMNEEEYNELISMFESDGWKYYIEGMKELTKAQTEGAVTGAVTNDQWQFLRGWLTSSRATLGYENFVRVSYEEQAKEDAGYADADL